MTDTSPNPPATSDALDAGDRMYYLQQHDALARASHHNLILTMVLTALANFILT